MNRLTCDDIQVQRLINAAIAYVEIRERHMAKEAWRTKILQEAANMAQTGDKQGAKQKQMEAQLTDTEVFDYSEVSKNLIAAIKPFRT